ncbi:hypothetical protein H4217_006916 [Coemansia sp. RSA 1939]|nr:hypothetical protein H4217_006916 [Coemansia sp. RSA 1939]KAJ2602185.1 hypothetical protein EV177_006858 [Coemansia sp. RSA 1804]KAJ2689999.1 hypothetical protein GGH99_002717 [Coemansia sp. RSA 1285]
MRGYTVSILALVTATLANGYTIVGNDSEAPLASVSIDPLAENEVGTTLPDAQCQGDDAECAQYGNSNKIRVAAAAATTSSVAAADSALPPLIESRKDTENLGAGLASIVNRIIGLATSSERGEYADETNDDDDDNDELVAAAAAAGPYHIVVQNTPIIEMIYNYMGPAPEESEEATESDSPLASIEESDDVSAEEYVSSMLLVPPRIVTVTVTVAASAAAPEEEGNIAGAISATDIASDAANSVDVDVDELEETDSAGGPSAEILSVPGLSGDLEGIDSLVDSEEASSSAGFAGEEEEELSDRPAEELGSSANKPFEASSFIGLADLGTPTMELDDIAGPSVDPASDESSADADLASSAEPDEMVSPVEMGDMVISILPAESVSSGSTVGQASFQKADEAVALPHEENSAFDYASWTKRVDAAAHKLASNVSRVVIGFLNEKPPTAPDATA